MRTFRLQMAEINPWNNSKLGLMCHRQSAQRLPALCPSKSPELGFGTVNVTSEVGLELNVGSKQGTEKNTSIFPGTARTERGAQEIGTEQRLHPKCSLKVLFTPCTHDEISFLMA